MELDLIECSNLPMSTNKLILFLLLIPLIGFSQLPQTNIYHFNITKVANNYRLKSPNFMTEFNKLGYNNQPSYFDDKVIYFATNYYDKDKTEIAKFDLFDNTLTRITYTQEKEYSPTKVPGKDAFSVIRVEADGETQTLSLYPLDGIGYAKRYMNNTKNIGYHVWLDKEIVGLFLVESPHHNLAIANAISERRKIILDNIGRCLKVDKNSNLVYVHKLGETWLIKSYNTQTNKSIVLVETLLGAEDFELMNDGTILMGQGSTLYAYNPKNSENWEEIADLSKYGISNIKRVASRRNSLVIVNEN